MQTLTKFPVEITYSEAFLPSPRHRKLRYREKEETLTLNIRTVPKEDTQLAFTLSDYGHTCQHQNEIIFYKGKLYNRCWRHLTNEERAIGLDGYAILNTDQFDREFCCWDKQAHPDETREHVIRRLRAKAREYLFINGEVWETCGEPRYVIITFGLGHNHGGSALFVENYYNKNISKTRYFSALDGEKAVEEFNRVASARGDTESVGQYSTMIEVHMPECVKLNPRKQHGNGEPFHNMLEQITENASSPAEAGLLAIIAASAR